MTPPQSGFHSPLADGIAGFLAAKRALGCRYDNEESQLRVFDRYLCRQRVSDSRSITPAILESFLASRSRPRPRSYNQLLGILDRLFKWLVRNGRLPVSPLQAKPRPVTGQRIPFLFNTEMARRLLDLAARLPDYYRAPLRGPTYRAIFALLYGLGLRVGEVCRLCCGDVDLHRSLLTLRGTKFGKSRLVPFGPRLADFLRAYLSRREQGALPSEKPLFSFVGGKPVNRHSIDRTFQLLVTKLDLAVPPGVAPPRVHDLRRAFAVGTLLRWYRSGVDPTTRLFHLAAFLGHVSPTSTAEYLTITPALLEAANQRFECAAAALLGEATS